MTSHANHPIIKMRERFRIHRLSNSGEVQNHCAGTNHAEALQMRRSKSKVPMLEISLKRRAKDRQKEIGSRLDMQWS